MEFKKIEIDSEGSKPGGNDASKFAAIQPVPLASYSKIYTIYPFQETPSTIEEDKNRDDAGGSLNIVENDGTFESSSLCSDSNVEGSSLLSGFNSVEQEKKSGGSSRGDGTTSSGRRTISSTPKSPAPPSAGRKS